MPSVGFHGDRAHAAFAEMLLHFGGDVQRLGNIEAFAGDAHGVVNRRQVARFKLNVQHRADDLHHSSDAVRFSAMLSPKRRTRRR